MAHEVENQNTKDIRYVDEKIDNLKTEVNKNITKQAVATSKLEGEVRVLESELRTSTTKLENKIDRVQNDLNKNFNELTATIIKLEAQSSLTAQAIIEIKDTLKEQAEMRAELKEHEVRLDSIESQISNSNKENIDIKKEKIKGKFSLSVAIASGVLAIVSTLLALLIK